MHPARDCQGLVRRISSRTRWFAVGGGLGDCGSAGGRVGTYGFCCWGTGWTPCGDRYLKKLMPVPGIVKDTQSDPVGARPIRKPAMPQLTPIPRDVIVVLAPPPRFIDRRKRQPIGRLLHSRTLNSESFYAQKDLGRCSMSPRGYRARRHNSFRGKK